MDFILVSGFSSHTPCYRFSGTRCLMMSSVRFFHKHTKLKMLALLHSYIFIVFFFIEGEMRITFYDSIL